MKSTSSVDSPLLAPRAAAKSAMAEDLRFFYRQYGFSGQKVKAGGRIRRCLLWRQPGRKQDVKLSNRALGRCRLGPHRPAGE